MRTPLIVLAVLAVVALGAILVFGVKPAHDELTAGTWRWVATAAQDEAQPSTVPDPDRYTLTFETGRRFAATADCNEVAGAWRRQPPGRPGPLFVLQLTPDATTLAACAPDSLAQAFLDDLEAAASYTIVDGVLTITLADGATMTFR
jgi:heat shock protein HslJ